MNAPLSLPTLSLLDRFLATREATSRLVAPLSAEDQMVQSCTEASPTKWHLAHTTWFFETFILKVHSPNYLAFDDRFTFLFNSYYKQLEDGHPVRTIRGHLSRPSLQEVLAYREAVDDAIAGLLSRGVTEEVEALLETGIHHEQQHQELILTDIKHALWTNPLRPAYEAAKQRQPAMVTPMEWLRFAGGTVQIGHSGNGFCFDNELPHHNVLLRDFKLASRLVTCGEYLDFIADGGYRRPELWLSDGWDTVCNERWPAPLYWEKQQGQWSIFTLGGVRPVALQEPVCHVSYYEADAYARWAGARLPLESEWESVASSQPVEGNFAESGVFHPMPARQHGLTQMFGDVWEWTASPYTAYPGFRPNAGALGEYNGKFMCNQLILRGGSCATPASHIRASYRNFFPPQARWQFMGIRLANDCS